MGKPLSVDLRDRVRDFVESDNSCHEAARHFGVSPSFVINLMALVRATGSVAPRRQGRPKGSGKFAPFCDFLRARVEANPDITMPELSEALWQAHGVTSAPAALSRFLIRQGYSLKKNAGRNRTPAPKG